MPWPKGRPFSGEKARYAMAQAQDALKHLTEKQALRALRPTREGLKKLHEVACGKGGRGAMAIVSANRTTLEWTVPKPAVEHELSGNVTITVQSPLSGAPGSRAKTLDVVAKALPKSIETTPESGYGRYVTNGVEPLHVDPLTNEPEQITEPEPDALLAAPSIIEDGKLTGRPDTRTAEQRRADERVAWMADREAHPETDIDPATPCVDVTP